MNLNADAANLLKELGSPATHGGREISVFVEAHESGTFMMTNAKDAQAIKPDDAVRVTDGLALIVKQRVARNRVATIFVCTLAQEEEADASHQTSPPAGSGR